jgi:hypothetical protein
VSLALTSRHYMALSSLLAKGMVHLAHDRTHREGPSTKLTPVCSILWCKAHDAEIGVGAPTENQKSIDGFKAPRSLGQPRRRGQLLAWIFPRHLKRFLPVSITEKGATMAVVSTRMRVEGFPREGGGVRTKRLHLVSRFETGGKTNPEDHRSGPCRLLPMERPAC